MSKIPEHFRIAAVNEPEFFGTIAIYITGNEEGKRLVGRPLEYDAIVSDGRPISPAIRMEKEAAQRLMDSLWDCGLRPSEGTGSAGAMAATQRHLEDMRTLVFDGLKLSKPR